MQRREPAALNRTGALPMNPAERASIERFVRDTLGCRCPDEVFESITVRPASSPESAEPYTRLVVGSRLLIYVLESPGQRAAPATVERLARRGLSERDEHGFNRFRLVVGCDPAARVPGELAAGFASITDNDDRAHLHVIAASQLPDVLRSK